jgi:hypothetical protein
VTRLENFRVLSFATRFRIKGCVLILIFFYPSSWNLSKDSVFTLVSLIQEEIAPHSHMFIRFQKKCLLMMGKFTLLTPIFV